MFFTAIKKASLVSTWTNVAEASSAFRSATPTLTTAAAAATVADVVIDRWASAQDDYHFQLVHGIVCRQSSPLLAISSVTRNDN